MGRPRRKVSVDEDNASTYSTPPGSKDQENRFPTSLDEDQKEQIITLRKNFDHNGKQWIYKNVTQFYC